jgi:hypothetical protein
MDQVAKAASNRRGDLAIAWADRRGLRVAVRKAGHRFGRARLVPHSGSARLQEFERFEIAMDDRGGVVIAWTYNDRSVPPDFNSRDEGCCLRVRATRLVRGRRFLATRTISPGRQDAFALALAMSRRGAAAIVWTRAGLLEGAFARRGRSFGHARGIAGVRYANGVAPFVAYTARGRTLVTWAVTVYAAGSTPLARVLERTRSAAGRWSDRRTVGVLLNADSPHIETDASGAQVAAWRGPRGRILAARRPAGGHFGAAHQVGPAGGAGSYTTSPGLAVAPDGSATIAWRTFPAHGFDVLASTAAPAKRFRPPTRLRRERSNRGFVTEPVVAAGSGDLGFVVWPRNGGDRTPMLVAAARDGRFGAARRLPTVGRTAEFMGPAITALPHGRAAAVIPTPRRVGVAFGRVR